LGVFGAIGLALGGNFSDLVHFGHLMGTFARKAANCERIARMFGSCRIFIFRLLLCGLAWSFFQVSHAARVVQDDRGVELTLGSPAKRIVSLYPSLTESVCLLNACDRLVGVDRSSNWPEWVQSVPHLGGLWDTSLEELVRLRPDVVLMSFSNPKLTHRLEALGVSVLVFQPQTVEQMKRMLREITKLVDPVDTDLRGESHVEQLILQMELDFMALKAKMPQWSKGRRIYLEVGSEGYAASQSSYIGQMLQAYELINVVPTALGEFPKMNREWLLRQSPDIMVLAHGQKRASLKTVPGLRVLKPVIENRVCVLSQDQSDRLLRLGPRLVSGVRSVVDCINQMRPL
jgi:iron complex transport system substrate-binding protein